MASILVIDDSQAAFLTVKSTLTSDGHSVHRVESPLELPRFLRESPTDLILMDLEMPRYSGLSIGAMLKNYDKTHTPILIYSSRPLGELQAVARLIDAVGVLEKTKPISELRSMVCNILKRVIGQ